ncbi:hypothetical protein MNBD_GAMMA04-2223 [hydrothermal vent metagenome]|uniref:Uncharacterized protein n=1 Tax=hydrothermal vent metagenome TaxID=652676 RepID=A0A3B0W383_9ZZZZ
MNAKKTTLWLLISLILPVAATACCVAYPTSSHDQVIEGPYHLTTEWQTIKLDKPFITTPHIQVVEFLFPVKDYEFVEVDEPKSRYLLSNTRLKRLTDNQITKPEVILVNQHGQEFQAFYKSSGGAENEFGFFKMLGFGNNPDEGYFFYPKGIEFVALKVRANVPMEVPYIKWISRSYYQEPTATWESVHPSEVIDFDNLP